MGCKDKDCFKIANFSHDFFNRLAIRQRKASLQPCFPWLDSLYSMGVMPVFPLKKEAK